MLWIRAVGRGAGRRRLARKAPTQFGGGGADFLTTALLLEEAGYSPLGPLATNCAAPDEGNMRLLAMTGSAGQQERYLRPLVAGRCAPASR